MEVFLTFNELSEYIMRHYGKHVDLAREGERSVRATYRAGLFSQSVSLQVAQIEDNRLTVAFTGGMLVNLLLKWFHSSINSRLGAGIAIFRNHYLIIDLKAIPQAQALSAALDLREVEVRDSAMRIVATLK